MSVTSQQNKTGECEELVVSDLQRFMSQNPNMAEELMKIMVSQFNNPTKISLVQSSIQQQFNIECRDTSLADSLRAENLDLQTEIYDM